MLAHLDRHLDRDLDSICKAADPQLDWERIPFVLEARLEITKISFLILAMGKSFKKGVQGMMHQRVNM